MLRIPVVLLSLCLVSVSAFAGADVAVSLHIESVPIPLKPGQTFNVSGSVTNLGFTPAKNVEFVVTAGPSICQEFIPVLAANDSRFTTCTGKVPESRAYIVAAAVSAYGRETPDDNYNNNSAVQFIRVDTPPDLVVYGSQLDIPKPGLPFPLQVSYTNLALTEATNTKITIFAPERITKAPDFCTIDGNQAVCDVGTVERGPNGPETRSFVIELVAPDASAMEFTVTTKIDGSEEDAYPNDDVFFAKTRTYRTFTVTTTNDSGSGSLRAAVEAANAECTDDIPCLAAFRIPPGAGAWHTIALESPLPRIMHPVFIDGTTQSGYFSDTNPAGPEIEISGSALSEGNGFELVCTGEVRGLAINGFPDNGVATIDQYCSPQPVQRAIRNNYIGTDPTGTRAIPNLRGVNINADRWLVDGNVISGNTRSGVFVSSGVTKITNNKIGLTPSLQPLGNGASGVFIGAAASGSDVSNNYIGFNHDFGVSIARDAYYVSADHNSLQGNFQHGIDWGLDGVVTANRVPIPEITSVRVENGKTIVEGTTTATGTFPPRVAIYANDAPDPSGYGEGQYVLGDALVGAGTKYPFTFTYDGDLRGKWITATATSQYYTGWLRRLPVDGHDDTGWGYYTTTSEFSRAVEVK